MLLKEFGSELFSQYTPKVFFFEENLKYNSKFPLFRNLILYSKLRHRLAFGMDKFKYVCIRLLLFLKKDCPFL